MAVTVDPDRTLINEETYAFKQQLALYLLDCQLRRIGGTDRLKSSTTILETILYLWYIKIFPLTPRMDWDSPVIAHINLRKVSRNYLSYLLMPASPLSEKAKLLETSCTSRRTFYSISENTDTSYTGPPSIELCLRNKLDRCTQEPDSSSETKSELISREDVPFRKLETCPKQPQYSDITGPTMAHAIPSTHHQISINPSIIPPHLHNIQRKSHRILLHLAISGIGSFLVRLNAALPPHQFL
ncbi:hypothetical protein J6590_014321 [Homalodisca vitripennis]|nr:hypothetical protein J6590_014321 [Homalodisca vitripennis]